MQNATRRPLKSRGTSWARVIAAWLARHRVSPNAISLSSVFFAAVGATALWCLEAIGAAEDGWRILCLATTLLAIQARLLANLFDGMVAVEGGLGGPCGDLYNEVPDRISDALLLLAAGSVAAGAVWPLVEWLGPVAACLALCTAYLRALGASLGVGQAFHGPMAKPHRMFLLSLGCGIGFLISDPTLLARCFAVVLGIMVLGMLVTLIRRWTWIAVRLRHPTP